MIPNCVTAWLVAYIIFWKDIHIYLVLDLLQIPEYRTNVVSVFHRLSNYISLRIAWAWRITEWNLYNYMSFEKKKNKTASIPVYDIKL